MKPTLNKFNLSILAALVCLGSLSCKKLLEVPPNPSDRISTDQAFSDSANVMNVLAGIYSNFEITDAGFAAQFFNGGMTIYTGMSGDELINRNVSLLPYQTPYYINSLNPKDAYLSVMWSKAYSVIYSANISLTKVIGNKNLSKPFTDQLTGELKFLRAWTYFHLVNIFGGVPLVTGTDFRVNAALPRETIDKLYAFMISELEDAQKLLVPDYPSSGYARPNVYVAKAFLAKVYLYHKEWQKAAALSGEVIDAGAYSLEPDLANVFLLGSTEALWQYPVGDNAYSETNEGATFIPYPGSIPDFEINPSLLNAFEPDDLRLTNWIKSEDVNGTIYNYPYKYKKRSIDDLPQHEAYIFLRLGEQYLIRAEARAQLDQSATSLEDLNAIRERAGLADLSFTDKQTLLNDIFQERRIELFCEWGNRWFDMKRTNNATTVFGTKPNWQATDVLYPIPLIEMQTNPALVQNPGY